MIDYRTFRFSKLNTPEFCHLKLLMFWPVYLLSFLLLERIWIRDSYYPIYSILDSYIPFCEYFLIPYLFWFVFLAGIHLYTLLFDIDSFRRLMWFLIISFSLTTLVYIVFPNCQALRPPVFERDNIFTRFLTGLYQFDTNTNVCPSLHVIGSVAVVVGAWDSKHLNTAGWRCFFVISAFFISISTVFLKQHSIVDVVMAIPVCLITILAMSISSQRT